MNGHYDRWKKNAPKWEKALNESLCNSKDKDIVTQYSNVALAFPSTQPNSYSFDYPTIDEVVMFEWAAANGWQVRMAPEMSPNEDGHNPPVRFTKIG